MKKSITYKVSDDTKLTTYNCTAQHRKHGEEMKPMFAGIIDWTSRATCDNLIKYKCPDLGPTGHDTIGIHAYLVQTGFFEARHVYDGNRYKRNNKRLELRVAN